MTEDASRGEQVVGSFLILGLAIALAAPPGLQTAKADEVCSDLGTERTVPEAEWSMLPIPHWTCVVEDEVIEHLGWWL